MTKDGVKKIIISLIFIIIFFVINQKVVASYSENIIEKKEYSEEFKKWIELSEEEKKKVLMPRMYEVPFTKVEYKNPLYSARMLRANINSQYSLKDTIPENLVIRNQQKTNTCWAFARLSSLETNLALSNYKKGINLSKVYDFSERHMEYATSRYFLNDEENPLGYNRIVGDGGTRLMADNYLANGYGAVPESEMPFENNENIIDISQIQNKTVATQLYDTIDFPDYNNEASENKTEIMNQVKQHIQNYGSVYAGLHGDSASTTDFSCYNNETSAKFCNNSDEHPSNHAISIIGWDDNYSIENFSEEARPTSNGAWIVRNSWGEKNDITDVLKEVIFDIFLDQCIENGWDTPEKIPNDIAVEIANQYGITGLIIEDDIIYEKYGDNGLIYVSYEDVNISKEMSGIVKATDTINYDNIYGYDELGTCGGLSLNNSSLMLCNIFDRKTTKTEYLNQVQLYVLNACTCKVYVNPNGTDISKENLQLVPLKAGESETFNVGYHTLEFSKPIAINSDSFAIVVEVQSATGTASFAIEEKPAISIASPYSKVKTEIGKCFMAIGNDLENCEWVDLGKLSQSGLGTLLPNGDSTIKAFTTNELYDESLKNIEITTPPNKTSYFEGENFDKTGMVVRANYNSKTNPTVTLDSSDYNITNGTNLKAGQTSVTITYEDKSVNQTISVEKNSVTELRIKVPPTKIEYKEGQHFDTTGMVIEATYKDGTTKEVTEYTIENGNNLKANQTEIIISYGGKTISQQITVIPNPLIEIKITKEPNKIKYVEGQNFDKTGMIVTGTYQDQSIQEIIEYTIEDGTNLKKEQTFVTIKYEDKTTTQEITVEEKTIIEIAVDKKPSKLTYIQNKEELDLTDGNLKVIYNDGTSENIPLESEEVVVTGFDNTKIGKQKLTITYQSKTTELEIEIVEEERAENSNFDNIKSSMKKVQAYYYTDDSQKDYVLIDVEISDIIRNLNNDLLEYYYYLSPNDNEQSINDWVKITEEQTSEDKLQFRIDSRNIANYSDLINNDILYLYIKEVAIKGGDQSVAISKSMKLETDNKIETYVNNAKVNNVNSDNNENPEMSNQNEDTSIVKGKLPNAGINSILIVILVIIVIGIIAYIRYKNISKYIK